MEKVIRDGKVAVIYSSDYTGWYSDHGHEALLYHPELVRVIEEGGKITEELCESLGFNVRWCGDAHSIQWVPVGMQFTVIDWNDGMEIVVTEDDLKLTA
jgi:hypothetical protein